ncbi:acyltransferase family protein [Croceibacterium mercuriale]|uniref:acyltransferase family protein n=1 Tax=Croceibacterium mercuriale TaxID=1572751 RepID=UPI0013792BA7|nr:acyltransferase [Croceibacterium mercuriale]
MVHLQTLRGLAASAVVATHAVEYPIRRGLLPEEFYRLAWALGWLGVAVFFVISGLIMIHSADREFGSAEAARRFALRRVVRVVPLYWLATIPFAVAQVARGEALTADMVVRSLLFIPYAGTGMEAARPIVGQGWTLNYEMLFYVLFTATLLLPRRIGLPVLLGFFPLVIALRSLVWPLVPYRDPTSPLPFWSDPITLLFVIGLVIGLVQLRRTQWHQVRHPVAGTVAVLGAAIAIFLAAGGGFPMPVWWQALFAVAGGLSAWLCTSHAGHRYPRAGLVAEAAGDASYSTYLFHPLMLMVLYAVWERTPLAAMRAGPALFVALALVACNVGGWLIFRWLERPLTRRLAALTGRKRPPLPVVA